MINLTGTKILDHIYSKKDSVNKGFCQNNNIYIVSCGIVTLLEVNAIIINFCGKRKSAKCIYQCDLPQFFLFLGETSAG